VGPQATGAAIVPVNDRDRVRCVNRPNADDRYGKQSCRRDDKNNWACISTFAFKHSFPEFVWASSQDSSELENRGACPRENWAENRLLKAAALLHLSYQTLV
jgi:hypothetical protein